MFEKQIAARNDVRPLLEDELDLISGGCNTTTSVTGRIRVRGTEVEVIGGDDTTGCA